MKLFPGKTKLGYLFKYYHIRRTRSHNIKIQRYNSRRIAKNYFICEESIHIIVIEYKKNLIFEDALLDRLMCNKINFKLGRAKFA